MGQCGPQEVQQGPGWGPSCLWQAHSRSRLWGLLSSCGELFSGNFPALLKASAVWNTWLVKENKFWGGADGIQDWVSWTSMHTGGPLSLLLGLCATRGWLGPFVGLVGRLLLSFGLCATWALCHLGFVPFGSGQDYLWYQLAGNKMLGFACECSFGQMELWIQVWFICSCFVWVFLWLWFWVCTFVPSTFCFDSWRESTGPNFNRLVHV